MCLYYKKMLIKYIILLFLCAQMVFSYTNKQFTIVKPDSLTDFQCDVYNSKPLKELKDSLKGLKDWHMSTRTIKHVNFSFATVKTTLPRVRDPLNGFEKVIQQVVYGRKVGKYKYPEVIDDCYNRLRGNKLKIEDKTKKQAIMDGVDLLAHLPTGRAMRAEMFHNKSSVHLAFTEYLHRGHAYLKITRDHMQTAVDAFAIFLAGNLEDVMRLPPAYVLQSARTIAMMRIAREKLATTWFVVKGSTPSEKVSYETLEKFRPLFKYINGKEMARLNLMDRRILSFIGTHPDLNRHQVGVVASKYLQLNPNWTQPKYLNVMNNLLCGVPMIFMRRIPKNTYLQLTHQLFYHIKACDPLQRRFYLQMMTRTQALGKSYSWSARDVSRLGLLLAEVDGPSLSAINPEAMAGITSKVMLEMPSEALQYITEMQLRYLEPKALNILARKLNAYQSPDDTRGSGNNVLAYSLRTYFFVVLIFVGKYRDNLMFYL